jgi:hypothetical protein
VNWVQSGYWRVAYLPNPKGSGSSLLLSGMDLYSSEGGADFVTREERIRELRARFGLKPGEKMPSFDVVVARRY